jgi:hypothetical protein
MACGREPACSIKSDGWPRQLIHLQFDANSSSCARPLDGGLDESLANPGASAPRLDPHTEEVGGLRRLVHSSDRHPDEFVVIGCLDEPDAAVTRCHALPPGAMAEALFFRKRTPERLRRISQRSQTYVARFLPLLVLNDANRHSRVNLTRGSGANVTPGSGAND